MPRDTLADVIREWWYLWLKNLPLLVEIVDWLIITLEGTEKGLNERLISVRFGVKWCKSSQPGTVREDQLMLDQFKELERLMLAWLCLVEERRRGNPVRWPLKVIIIIIRHWKHFP